MSKQTIKSIITEMTDVVKQKQQLPPSYWIDKAIDLTVLWSELKEQLLEREIQHNKEVAIYIEEGKKVNESERLVAANSDNYKMYKYLEGRNKIIKEFIMIAKKRATIDSEHHY